LGLKEAINQVMQNGEDPLRRTVWRPDVGGPSWAAPRSAALFFVINLHLQLPQEPAD
jgi:hypothetical protein